MRFIHPDLLSRLETGTVAVTSSSTLAAILKRQYAERQLSLGRRSWREPGVWSVGPFLERVWRDAVTSGARDTPLLLSRSQEQMLWEQAIERSGVRVLAASTTARQAMAAAKFVADWRLPLDHPSWEGQADTSEFRSWFLDVRKRCQENGWVSNSDLFARVSEAAGRLRLPERIVFAGFEERSQAMMRLAAAMEKAGCEVEFLDCAPPESDLLSIRCSDFEDELGAAARWARARLEEQPKLSIAILVPNLRQNRSAVARILRDLLQPASIFDPVIARQRPLESAFYVHCGFPLAQHPVVRAALALFEFTAPHVPATSVTAFLCSPFIAGAAAERRARAGMDARLRRLRETELSLEIIEAYSAGCPQLQRCWPRIREIAARVSGAVAEPGEWGRLWRRLLDAAGWPGTEALTPLEKEAVEQWRQVLSAFDQLGLTAPPLSLDEALAHLRSMAAADGPVAGDLHSPIQVLEPADAASLRFDSAWLVGASELEWPPAAFAPAFIPFELQRKENLEIATANGRREAAERLSASIRRAANHVVVSFSSGDASDSNCSPLFSGAREVTRDELHIWEGRTVLEQLERVALETVDDTRGPALKAGATVAGGTHLLKSQSACPFQAFARWRLKAEGLDEGVFSFDARDRGDFLHRSLANVWHSIEDSDRLRQMTDGELAAAVSDAVAQALASDSVDTAFRVQLRRAESDRLSAVILDWLKRERGREGKFRPRDIEKKFEFKLSNLPLSVRVDRIDEVDGGRLVVIDYKSGRVDRKNLDNDRPQEPQLLVYAALEGSNVDGLYFASVRRDEGGASGYGRVAHFGDKKEVGPLEWEAQLAQWSATVTRLAEEFESGRAPVSPARGACDYCELKPICRIAENRGAGENGE